MPNPCYRYPADAPWGARSRSALPPAPLGLRQMPANTSCFRYQADVPLTMPFSCFSYPSRCFSYPGEVPPGGGNPDAAQLPLSGLRRMPLICFRY